jgi:uncharacterized protein YndB with AHSA1/START domain
MRGTRHSVVVQRPIEDVFAVLTDVTLVGRWFPLDVEERWTTPEPHGVGSVRRATVRILGRTAENDAVVTAYEPPRLAALRGVPPRAPFDATLRFAPVPGGTQVDVGIEIRMGGLMRPVGALVGRWYGARWERGLANLKRMMESGEL